jgi:hypothetical protein
MLHSERPKKSCDLAPLRALGELDPRADAAARAVVVVIAVLEVFGPCVVPREVRVVDVAVWVEATSIFVLGVVKGPVRDDDGCVFGLELPVNCVILSAEDGVMAYNEHTVVPVILGAAVRDTSRNALQKLY